MQPKSSLQRCVRGCVCEEEWDKKAVCSQELRMRLRPVKEQGAFFRFGGC